MEDDPYLVVLESDWSADGEATAVGKFPVGPDLTYRDVFAGCAATFGAKVDRAGFASKEGFRALARRYFSKKEAPYLIVGGHGSRTGKLHPPAGPFDPWRALLKAGEGHKGKCGLLFASCELADTRRSPERLLREGVFEWVAGYRTGAYALSGVLTELCFWRSYFEGWRYKKTVGGERYRQLSLTEDYDPLEAALLTYFEIAASVGCRFDVRTLIDDEVVSSLEMFSHIIADGNGILDLHGDGLDGVVPSAASIHAADRFSRLAKRVWEEQWEWEVEA